MGQRREIKIKERAGKDAKGGLYSVLWAIEHPLTERMCPKPASLQIKGGNMKKKVEEKDAQLYRVTIGRMKIGSYGTVSIGAVEYILLSGGIKQAYESACKKGKEVFGDSVCGKEYNAVQVKVIPMSKNEE